MWKCAYLARILLPFGFKDLLFNGCKQKELHTKLHKKIEQVGKNEDEDEETQALCHHLSMIFEFYRLLEAVSLCRVQPKGNSNFMQTHKAWEKAFSPPAHSAECIKSDPVCSCRSTSPILHLLFIFLKYRNCIDACIHVHRLVATVIAVNIVIIVVVVVQNNFTGHAQPT